MKTKLLLICLITGLNVMAQSPVCFTTPDGTASSWSYKDYIIPTGYRIDSVLMDATRPGYSTQNFDFVFESCQGTTIFNNSIGTYPFDYNTDNNSEYNVWINLTSFNYVSVGMVRVSLPTNAGAVWNQVCFAISPIIIDCGILNDTRDGQQYQTVSIGTQCWMRQNLNYGTQVADLNTMTNNSIVEKVCYNNTASNCSTYGGIYTYDEAMNYGTNSNGICPNGWHIPTQAEFQTLISFLGATTAGQQMKATSTNSPSWDGTNASGFTAIPGGVGNGLYMGTRETFWSSTSFSTTDAYDYDLNTGSNTITESNNTKNSGYCIRCIQDITTGIYSPDGAVDYFVLYPNPTNDICDVTFRLNANATVKLTIYNLIGEVVSTGIDNSQLSAGEHKVSINTSELVNGIYFVNITVDGKTTIKKMVKMN